MNKPKLYVLIGISSSGKSTVAKELVEKENAVIISSDAIRAELCSGNVSDQSKNEEVFKIFHSRIKENLLIGNNVIADATNIKIKSRRAILECTRNIDCEKIAYIVPKKIEDCIKDNYNNDRIAVPDWVIERQVTQFEIPFYEEGFDQIIIHKNLYSYTQDDINMLGCTMVGFDQENSHHTETLYNHCITVYKDFRKRCEYAPYKYAALWHDIGKTMCKTYDDNGEAHYYSHHNIGCYVLLNYFDIIKDRYGFISDEMLDFLFLINYHMLPFFWEKEKTHEKYKKIFGEEKYQMLIDFNECDRNSK